MTLMQRRRGLMGATRSEPKLPDEFQRVEWIGAAPTNDSNGPHIITSTFLSNDPFVVDFGIMMQDSSYSMAAFGCRQDSAANSVGFDLICTPRTKILELFCGVDVRLSNIEKDVFLAGKITVQEGKKTGTATITCNGRTASASGTIRDRTGGPVCLFGVKNYSNTAVRYHFHGRFYYLKMAQNNSPKIDMVPCYRKSDNTIGMYDRVTDTFYTNSGSGTFTKGADVL